MQPVNFKKLHPAAVAPVRGSAQAAGLDLCTVESAVIGPGVRALLKTGIAIALPENTVGLIWPRSKLANRYGLDVLAGVVDADYRGEVMVSVINHGHETIELRAGDRCAQLLVQPVLLADAAEVEALDDTERGAAGINDTELRIR